MHFKHIWLRNNSQSPWDKGPSSAFSNADSPGHALIRATVGRPAILKTRKLTTYWVDWWKNQVSGLFAKSKKHEGAGNNSDTPSSIGPSGAGEDIFLNSTDKCHLPPEWRKRKRACPICYHLEDSWKREGKPKFPKCLVSGDHQSQFYSSLTGRLLSFHRPFE